MFCRPLCLHWNWYFENNVESWTDSMLLPCFRQARTVELMEKMPQMLAQMKVHTCTSLFQMHGGDLFLVLIICLNSTVTCSGKYLPQRAYFARHARGDRSCFISSSTFCTNCRTFQILQKRRLERKVEKKWRLLCKWFQLPSIRITMLLTETR